ncbi:MAG TPA: cation/H(+) antiporter [Bacteroidales bacterium]|nr:cation/H(+) antiporter [Bacteroidales bacterium]
MKKFRNIIFYIGIISGFSALMYWIVVLGTKFEIGRDIIIPNSDKGQWAEFITSLVHNLEHPLAVLLAQIVTIIFVSRFLGMIFKKIGQPSVIGEIIAGIILGPSLIGMYFPEFTAALFPSHSLGNLQFLSQIGLILFMFIVGMELDLKVLKTKAHDAIVISHASIIIPFALGMGLAYFIYESFAPTGVQFSSFGLFVGISMSITAFPVLARIVQERGINKTRIGTIVITCAAADDITGWSLLAAIIAIVKAGSFISSIYTILLAVGYVLFMIKVVRPFLRRVGNLHSSRASLSKSIVAIFFLTLILSSYATEIIGIHALFGAFMAGAIMPDNAKFRNIFIEKVEDVALVLLLPLFFVFTGLRTEIGLLNDPHLWKVTGLIILVAVTGKFIGSALAAKYVGQNWKDSLTIGALMNTRGLMELVILNIGYDLGVLTPEIFTMMVIMALVTTFMTGPALTFINWAFKSPKAETEQELSAISRFKILVSFSNPLRGVSLLRLANSLVKRLNGNASVTVMHLSPSNEYNSYNLEKYEKDNFHPIIQESHNLNQKITTLFKASNDIENDIASVANKGDFDLLLVGIGQSIFEGSLLGKIFGLTTKIINPDRIINQVIGKENIFKDSPFDERTNLIISKSDVSIGILIDKDLKSVDKVIIPLFTENDAFLIKLAQKLIHNSDSQITFIDVNGQLKNSIETKESIKAIEQIAPNHINLINKNGIDLDSLNQQSLMLISIFGWKSLIDEKSTWLAKIPSTLIIDNKS